MKCKIFFLSFFVFTSCEQCREDKDDDLCSSREVLNSDIIRKLGYFYDEYGNGAYREIYFFYNNGVIMTPGVIESQYFEDLTPFWNANNFFNSYQNNKLNWGIYSIQDSMIRIERWYPSEVYFPVFRSTGRILNDSTFVINHISRCDGSEASSRNEIWHFKQFSPKPDSTNSFTN